MAVPRNLVKIRSDWAGRIGNDVGANSARIENQRQRTWKRLMRWSGNCTPPSGECAGGEMSDRPERAGGQYILSYWCVQSSGARTEVVGTNKTRI